MRTKRFKALLIAFFSFTFSSFAVAEERFEISTIEFLPKSGDASFLQAIPVVLPHVLPEQSPGAATWDFPLEFLTKNNGIAVLFDKQASKSREQKARLVFRLNREANSYVVTAVDKDGTVSEYQIKIQVRPQAKSDKPVEPNGAWTAGPLLYSRSIERSGTSLAASETGSAMMTGIRATGRYRLFKNFTQQLPGDIKLFANAHITLAKSVSGNSTTEGLSRWVEGDLSADFYQFRNIRFEGAFGFAHFAPGLSHERPGDPRSLLGFLISLRISSPLWRAIHGQIGVNYALSSSQNTDVSTLVSQPVDFFAALKIPYKSSNYLETRFRYYQVKTSGTVVSSGTIERSESFFGPELVWVGRF